MPSPMTSSRLPKLVLSIQSHVAYGHAGNSAAVFPLQRLGFEVLPVHTVQFSNHTGYGAFRGQVFSADHIREVIAGLADRGVLARVDAVLSGYMGDATTGAVIVEAVHAVKRLNPGALYLCDPVMGDVGRGVFVHENIPAFARETAIPAADIVTPNQFEFELVTGCTLASVGQAVSAARNLTKTGPSTVVITSLATPDLPQGELGTLAVTPDEAWLVTTPCLPLQPLPNGMGDVFSAVLLGRTLDGLLLSEALGLAVSTLFALVANTTPGSRDLPLIAEQDEIAAPRRRFMAVAVG